MEWREPRLTKKQFIEHWLEPDESGRNALDYFREALYENECQYRSECALFGDAGPGQGLRVANGKQELARIEGRLREFGASV